MASTIKTMAKSRAVNTPLPQDSNLQRLFAGLFGLLLGLALLKFGNPVIMEKYVTWPTNIYEWLLTAWPVVIGYWLMAAVAVLGLGVARWKKGLPLVLVALPLVWWIWEVEAATQSEAARISWPVVVHFGTCVACFYLGLFSLSGVRRMGLFWMGLLTGFIIVLGSGLSQHFGGLEETRRYWFMYIYPTLKEIPPGLYKKMESNRIFATLFYPNTLAGVILMLLPVTTAVFWSLHEEFTAGARRLLMGLAAAAALGCLYWSGSKGGWLLMLVIGVAGAMYLPIKQQTKLALVALLLMLGLAGFMAKNLGYFKKGATSVNARFDYWSAAIKVAHQKPLFGNGPGMFGKAYERLKRPESEMAQMAHNDYLEQASDSGIIGFLAFSAFASGTLVYTWRNGQLRGDWVRLAVWLGLLGWALQSFVEFGLFIPAISWLAFAWMGWLLGQCRNQFDSGKAAG
jgi:hypothetical protein